MEKIIEFNILLKIVFYPIFLNLIPLCYKQTEPLMRLVAGNSLLLAHATGIYIRRQVQFVRSETFFPIHLKRIQKNIFTAPFVSC